MNQTDDLNSKNFQAFVDIIKTLRGPNGCPWDKEQTPRTMRGHLIEETYEIIESIDDMDDENLCEELGDMLLLIIMIAYMKEQEKKFGIHEVLAKISEKLIRRHPHVFNKSPDDREELAPDAVIEQWNDIKTKIEGKKEKKHLLDKIKKSLPPLERAFRFQKQAEKVGFDWSSVDEVHAKIEEELEELKDACAENNTSECELEIGDLLFSVVNLARFIDIDPAAALHRTNQKFYKRFTYIEEKMKNLGLTMEKKHMKKMDELWNKIRQNPDLYAAVESGESNL